MRAKSTGKGGLRAVGAAGSAAEGGGLQREVPATAFPASPPEGGDPPRQHGNTLLNHSTRSHCAPIMCHNENEGISSTRKFPTRWEQMLSSPEP